LRRRNELDSLCLSAGMLEVKTIGTMVLGRGANVTSGDLWS